MTRKYRINIRDIREDSKCRMVIPSLACDLQSANNGEQDNQRRSAPLAHDIIGRHIRGDADDREENPKAYHPAVLVEGAEKLAKREQPTKSEVMCGALRLHLELQDDKGFLPAIRKRAIDLRIPSEYDIERIDSWIPYLS